DGATLAYSAGEHLRLLDLDNRSVREVGADRIIGAARWTPDSSSLEISVKTPEATWVARRIGRVDGSTSEIPDFDMGSYSPDGSQAVNFVFGGKRVRLQRADGTRRALPVKGDYSFMRGASWSRDGRSLVVQTEVEGVATLWNVGVDGSQRRLIEERARISSA